MLVAYHTRDHGETSIAFGAGVTCAPRMTAVATLQEALVPAEVYDGMEQWSSSSVVKVGLYDGEGEGCARAATAPGFCDPQQYQEVGDGISERGSNCRRKLNLDQHRPKSSDQLLEEQNPTQAAKVCDDTGELCDDPSIHDDNGVFAYQQLAPIQVKMFTRRKIKGGGSAARGCDRCKSDLNAKLLVRCTSCCFQRHLYCFSPPLKQHPAINLSRTVAPSVAAALIAQWKCDKCAAAFSDVAAASDVGMISSPVDRSRPKKRDRGSKQTKLTMSPPSKRMIELSEAQFHPSREPERDSESVSTAYKPFSERTEGYDWYQFRLEKAAQVLGSPIGKDELVYYSRSHALMRKTAQFWHDYVQKRRRLLRQAERRQELLRGPQLRDVNHWLTEEDRAKLERTRFRQMTEQAEEHSLFNDAHTKNVYRRYKRESNTTESPTSETVEIGCMQSPIHQKIENEVGAILVELSECISAAAEDEDTVLAEGSVDVTSEIEPALDVHPSLMGLHLAACVIQRCVRYRRWHDRRMHERLVSTQIQEANKNEIVRHQTRTKVNLSVLKACAKVAVIGERSSRKVQARQALDMMMMKAPEPEIETPESTIEETSSVEDVAPEERAGACIIRFFKRHVRSWIALKKRVMVHRIQRWWRRTIRCWNWRNSAVTFRQLVRNRASRRIQRCYRRYRVGVKFKAILEKHAMRRLRLCLRRWIMGRFARKERARIELYKVALSIEVASDALAVHPEAQISEILLTVGMSLYSAGDFWPAAFVLEQYCKVVAKTKEHDWDIFVALAHSHHMAWHASYDSFNIERAHELYCLAVENAYGRGAGNTDSVVVDPLVLQDLAIVMMHTDNTAGSLRLLARLIEYFPYEPSFPFWLLMAAAQLQQKGDWDQSVEYLMYLADIPPEPYLERDIFALCAIGFQHGTGSSSAASCKEAWGAAYRHWTVEKKKRSALNVWDAQDSNAGANSASGRARLKWEVVTDLGERALRQGHYQLARHAYSYALSRLQTGSEHLECQVAWWNLADSHRHLGHIDTYLAAAKRSQECSDSAPADQEFLSKCQAHALQCSTSFRDEMKAVSVLEKLQQLASQQQSSS